MVNIYLLCWKKVQFYSFALYKPRLDIIQMTLAPVIFVQLIHILSRPEKQGYFTLMQEEKTKAGWELRCCCRGLHSVASQGESVFAASSIFLAFKIVKTENHAC